MSKKLKILYVEDDPVVLNSVHSTLKLIDFIEVDIAADGLEGFNLFNVNDEHYDMIITDIRMPKLSGLELLKKIKSKNINPYTVIVSAFNDKDYLLEAIDLDVSKYLTKPLDLSKLIDIIEQYHKKQIEELEYKQQKELLYLNAKLISMGEMIDSIAHQWMQPLSNITLQLSFIDYKIDEDRIEKEPIKESLNDMTNLCLHLSETLNEFREYVRPDKKKSMFTVNKVLEKALKLMAHTVKLNTLDIEVEEKDQFTLSGYPNQFIHIFINLINNTKDAFLDHKIEKKEIKIVIDKDEIRYTDNAGGIPKHILPKIFEANITSKEKGKGSGIGMYLSQNIACNNNVKIEASNTKNGAQFLITKVEE